MLKAKDALKDDVCLENVVKELLELHESYESYADSTISRCRDVFVECTAWIADHMEKCALCGTITHAGMSFEMRC